ncbi:MAG: hypothetical protein Q4F57_09215 [Weeksellaceae bacterium]|nr:hypothetical protein [Weeksellaceae bacterium]
MQFIFLGAISRRPLLSCTAVVVLPAAAGTLSGYRRDPVPAAAASHTTARARIAARVGARPALKAIWPPANTPNTLGKTRRFSITQISSKPVQKPWTSPSISLALRHEIYPNHHT